MRISLILLALGLITVSTGVATAQPAETPATRPDVLFIITDDMGPHLGCYGDKYVRTPVMDKLASDGIRFDNAWVAQASCSPSRSAIMTGLFPHQNGQIGLAHLGFSMTGEFDSLPGEMKKAGYYTGVIGKLHVKPASSFPFDYRQETGRKGVDTRDREAMSARIKEFLQQAGDKPFFLNLSYTDPHRPFPRQHKGLPEKPLAESEAGLLPFMKGLEEVPGLLTQVTDYYNAIMRVDALIGTAMDELRQVNRLDNTVIVLIGDHGAPFARAKVTAYHPGLHIPMIIRWPGVSKPGTSSKALVSTLDLLPTFMDVAGAEPLPDLQGKSLRTVIARPDAKFRDFLFAEFTAHLPSDYYPRRTLRDQQYQLIVNYLAPQPTHTPGIEGLAERDALQKGQAKEPARTAMKTYNAPPKYELYDLQKDPECFHNLAEDPELKPVVDKMLKRLNKWRVDTDDPLLMEGEIKRLGNEIRTTLDMKAGNARETSAPKKTVQKP